MAITDPSCQGEIILPYDIFDTLVGRGKEKDFEKAWEAYQFR